MARVPASNHLQSRHSTAALMDRKAPLASAPSREQDRQVNGGLLSHYCSLEAGSIKARVNCRAAALQHKVMHGEGQVLHRTPLGSHVHKYARTGPASSAARSRVPRYGSGSGSPRIHQCRSQGPSHTSPCSIHTRSGGAMSKEEVRGSTMQGKERQQAACTYFSGEWLSLQVYRYAVCPSAAV